MSALTEYLTRPGGGRPAVHAIEQTFESAETRAVRVSARGRSGTFASADEALSYVGGAASLCWKVEISYVMPDGTIVTAIVTRFRTRVAISGTDEAKLLGYKGTALRHLKWVRRMAGIGGRVLAISFVIGTSVVTLASLAHLFGG